MSQCRQLMSPVCSTEQHSKSSSKRLFASVFHILDHDDLEISSFETVDTNACRVGSMLSSRGFLDALHIKIKEDNLLDTYPILKVSCKDRKGKLHPIEIDDLAQVFSAFDNLYTVQSCKNDLTYYVMYTNFPSCFVAMKLLNGFSLRHSLSQLIVNWCSPLEYEPVAGILQDYHSKIEWPQQADMEEKKNQNSNPNTSNNSKQSKLTCRYDIQIENQKEFQVARRIIGAKGANMKKIIQNALAQYEEKTNKTNSNDILKLRLRGKGSGYKEGPDQVQSDEELHLCISAKFQSVYNEACLSVQKLLKNVYADYQDFTRRQGQPISLTIRKSQLCSQTGPTTSDNNNNSLKNSPVQHGRMEPSKIQQYLQLRNKARRELNFGEADRIRNYLRSCGVCLIDEKGRRGKAAEVTTWKYML